MLLSGLRHQYEKLIPVCLMQSTRQFCQMPSFEVVSLRNPPNSPIQIGAVLFLLINPQWLSQTLMRLFGKLSSLNQGWSLTPGPKSWGLQINLNGTQSYIGNCETCMRLPPDQYQSPDIILTPYIIKSHRVDPFCIAFANFVTAWFQSVLALASPQVALFPGSLCRSKAITVSFCQYLAVKVFQSLIHFCSGTSAVYHRSVSLVWFGRYLARITHSPMLWHLSTKQSRTSRAVLLIRFGLTLQFTPVGIGFFIMSLDQGIRTLLKPMFLTSCSRSSSFRIERPCTTQVFVSKPNQEMLLRVTVFPSADTI